MTEYEEKLSKIDIAVLHDSLKSLSGISFNNTYKYIYIIEDNNKLVKIGISVDPKQRHREIKSCNPYNPVVRCVLFHPQAHSIERELHQQFSRFNIYLEWFDIRIEDLLYLLKPVLNFSPYDEHEPYCKRCRFAQSIEDDRRCKYHEELDRELERNIREEIA